MVTRAQLQRQTLQASVRQRQLQIQQRAQAKARAEAQAKAKVQVQIAPKVQAPVQVQSQEYLDYIRAKQVLDKGGLGMRQLSKPQKKIYDKLRSFESAVIAGMRPTYKQMVTREIDIPSIGVPAVTSEVYDYPAGFVGPIAVSQGYAGGIERHITPSGYVPPPKPLPSFLQPQFETKAQQQFYQQYVAPKVEQLKVERQKYRGLGYTTPEAQRLAQASLIRGGVTFTPEVARKIIKGPTIKERIEEEGLLPVILPPIKQLGRDFIGEVEKVGRFVGDLPVTPFETQFIEPFPGAFTLTGVVPPTTIGAEVRRGRELISKIGEVSETGWEDILETTGVPTTQIIPEYEVPVFQKATLMGEPGKFESPFKLKIPEHEEPTLPGLIPKIVKYVPELGAYAIAPVPMFTADIITGAERLKTLDKDVEKEIKNIYQEHLKEKLEEGQEYLTLDEIRSKYSWQVKSQLKSQAELGIGVASAFLIGGAVLKTVKAFKRPIIDIKKPELFKWMRERHYVDPTGKKLGFFEYYGYQTPTKIRVTTPLRKTLGLKPKFDWTPWTKPQIRYFRPLGGTGVLGEQAYVGELGKVPKVPYGIKTRAEVEALFKKTGVRKVKVFEISGEGQLIKPQDISGLPKVERYVWQELYGKTEPLIVTGEGTQLSRAALESYEYFGKPGKMIKRFYTATEVKPILPVGESERALKFFETRTAFKDVTLPGARAAGKIEVIPGTLVEIPVEKLPPFFGELDISKFKVDKLGLKAVVPTGKPSLPYTDLALTQVQVQVPPTVLKFPKTPTPSVITGAVTRVEAPLMVGGAGLVTIPWAGEGVYERTEGGLVPGERMVIEELPPRFVQPPKIEIKQRIIPEVRPRVGVELKDILKVKPITKVIQKPIVKTILLPKVEAIPKVIQIPKVGLAQRQLIVPIQKVLPKLRVIPILRVSTRPRPTPKKPVVKIPPIIKLEVPSMKRFKRILKRPRPEVGYGFEIKRKGKWVRIKIPYAFATREGAQAEMMTMLQREAAASGRLVKSLKPVKKTRKRPTALQKVMFRPGKKKGVMVQKKLLRITTPGEVRQISLKGAAARRGVSPFAFGKPIKKAKRKAKVKKKKSTKKKKGGKKKR